MTDFNQSRFWHAAIGMPKGVFAAQTVSVVDTQHIQQTPYMQQNLALHVGDDAQQVQQNRAQLLQQLKPYGLTRLCWLNQTHSTQTYRINEQPHIELKDGDGLVTEQKGIGLVMMTADCLPIVVSNQEGTEVACIHAGWRGLADGVIESTVAMMNTQAYCAWMGAAISQPNFEVGEDVKRRFEEIDTSYANAFIAKENGKYWADLYAIATQKLKQLGAQKITGAEFCSYADKSRFYSYRRHAQTGRMATFVFISASC